MEATDILGHKVDAYGNLTIANERWESAAGAALAAINVLEGFSFTDVVQAIDGLGWSLEERDGLSVIYFHHDAASGRWRERHIRFLEEMVAAGFGGGVSVTSMDEDIGILYTLADGTVSTEPFVPDEDEEEEEDHREADDNLGGKFFCIGSLTIPSDKCNDGTGKWLAEAAPIPVPRTTDALGVLEELGWEIERVQDQVKVVPTSSGMFAGRWGDRDERFISMMARLGFVGSIAAASPEGNRGWRYDLARGYVAQCWHDPAQTSLKEYGEDAAPPGP